MTREQKRTTQRTVSLAVLEQTKEIYRDPTQYSILRESFSRFAFCIPGSSQSTWIRQRGHPDDGFGNWGQTAIFSVVYGILLRPLPNPEPERNHSATEKFQRRYLRKSVTYESAVSPNADLPFESFAAYTTAGFFFSRRK